MNISYFGDNLHYYFTLDKYLKNEEEVWPQEFVKKKQHLVKCETNERH